MAMMNSAGTARGRLPNRGPTKNASGSASRASVSVRTSGDIRASRKLLTTNSSLAQPPNTGDELMEQTRFACVEALGVEGLFETEEFVIQVVAELVE
jgi:hypothetical protein